MDNFFAYRSLYWVLAYSIAAAAIISVFRRSNDRDGPPLLLKVCALISIGIAGAIPLIYRLLPENASVLVWECDVAQQLFSSRQQGLELLDYAKEATTRNSGLVSSSAWSLLYGIPTYAALNTFGWSGLSLRLAGYIAGLLSLLVGGLVVRTLFNSSVAYIFIIVLATNPLVVAYMGYGIALTGTMLGVLVALYTVIRMFQSQGWALIAYGVLASAALVAATLNYGPGRLSILAILAFTSLFSVRHLLWRPRMIATGVVALCVFISAIAMIFQTNQARVEAAFLDARGEQAFIMMQHRETLREYLGDTEELKALQDKPLTKWIKIKFLLAVVKARTSEFIEYISPLRGIRTFYLRGTASAQDFTAFHSALSIPCLIGLCLCIRSWRSFRSLLLLTFFAGSLAPLFLTNRIDNYRFFMVLIPISIWTSDGLWRIIMRLRGGLLAELHCSMVVVGLTLSMAGHAWFFTALPDVTNKNVGELIDTIEHRMHTGGRMVLASTALSCSPKAEVDFAFAHLTQKHSPESVDFLPWRMRDCFSANRLFSDPSCSQAVLHELTKGPITVVTGANLVDAQKALSYFDNRGSIEQLGGFTVLTLSPSLTP